MSDSPRTDKAVIMKWTNSGITEFYLPMVEAEFARQLERELAAAKDGLKKKQGMLILRTGQRGRTEQRLAGVEKALNLVMCYPDIRSYLGSEICGLIDAAIEQEKK